jgi:hypothetical protein
VTEVAQGLDGLKTALSDPAALANKHCKLLARL